MNRLTMAAWLLPLLLAGCKLEIPVGEGGSVLSDSGSYDCAENTVCWIDISGTDFDETFVATPKSGYRFVQWQGGTDYVCADSARAICKASNIDMAGNVTAEAIIASDKKYMLKPIFERDSAPEYVLRDGNGDRVEEVMTVSTRGATLRLSYTDDQGTEYFYPLNFNNNEVGGTSGYVGWPTEDCFGEPTHITKDSNAVIKPLYSGDIALVINHGMDGTEDNLSLAKVINYEEAQYGPIYHRYPFGVLDPNHPQQCISTTDGWLVGIQILIKDIASIFVPPFTLSRE